MPVEKLAHSNGMEFSQSAVVRFSGWVGGGGGGGGSPLSKLIAGSVSLLHCAVVILILVWFLSPPPPTPIFVLFLFFVFSFHFSVLHSSRGNRH